ncbi:putative TonB-dependent receptor [Sulfurovum sp. enrichment culture clone C5]|uniref:Putative TonB-dependent receptor n=1 Tax=Sulfurovum sp. enrichment culture clone C5 TaxID=497650 RepID=A0A0S4XLD1_9BACT|nr:putative TonB-dependent receptor [Sulfurovum sp. enrichment culture clone C5]
MKTIRISIIASALLATMSTIHAEEDMGVIHVDSTTIDDRFESKKDKVSSETSIKGEKVDEKKAENIQRTLQSITGITTEFTDGDSLKIHIRGVENQVYMGEKPGVAVVIDGVPVFERTGSVNIDMDNIESIKVIKGGASYLFGDDALSGAVIITTKKGAKNAGGKVELEHGTYGYEKYLAKYGISKEKYNAYIQASRRTKDGYYEDGDYETNYLNGKTQYYIDDTSDITAGFEYSKRNKNSHGTVRGVTEAYENPKSIWTPNNENVKDYASMFDVELLKLFATYSKQFDDNKNLLVNVYQYGDNTTFYSGYADYIPIKDVDGNIIGHQKITDPKLKPNLNEYEQVQRGIKSEFRGNNGANGAYMVGLDLRANNYKNNTSYAMDWSQRNYTTGIWNEYTKGTVTSNDETDENVYALYGEYKYKINDKWSVTSNLRYDYINLDYASDLSGLQLEKSFKNLSYRAGANYQLNDHIAFYTALSTGFRSPSIQQLFAGTINPTGTVESNPNLKPEETKSFDIGVRGKSDAFGLKHNYEVGLFVMDRSDYIMSSVGQYSSPVSGEHSRYENIGGMRSQGLELSVQSELSEKLTSHLAYTYIDAYFTQYDNFNLILGSKWGSYTVVPYDLKGYDVPRVSKHHLNVALDYKPTANFTISPEIDAISPYYADELNRFKVPGHAVINLNLDYKTKIHGYDTSFYTRVDNLFDKYYYNTARASGDGNNDGAYNDEDISITVNEGRTINFGLQVKF